MDETSITFPCLAGRHDRCRGQVLHAVRGPEPCQCPHHDPAPAPDPMEVFLDRVADDALDRRAA